MLFVTQGEESPTQLRRPTGDSFFRHRTAIGADSILKGFSNVQMNAAIAEENEHLGDSALLRRFVFDRDQDAFGLLVGRYEKVVMGAAYRRSGNVELARDTAQKVFSILACRAASLVDHQCLGGWLYKAASFEAAKLTLSEKRRRKRESAYAEKATAAEQLTEPNWEPLERAMAKLPDAKRQLIVRHFFQDRGYPEMARELGLSEVATRKRVSRALAELGRRLGNGEKSVSRATQMITAAVAAQSVLSPPSSLAASAIATAGATPTLLASTIANMTTLKITTAATILVAIPLGLQWDSSRAAERELEHALQNQIDHHRPTAAKASAITGQQGLVNQIEASRSQLSTINAQLASEQKRLEKAKLTLELIGDELVISHGNPEAMGKKLAPLLRMISMDTDDLHDQQGEIINLLFASLPQLQAIPSLDETPAAKARFISALIIESSGLEATLAKKIEAILLPQLESAKQASLVYSARPDRESAGHGDWSRRYDEAARQQTKSLEPILPDRVTASEAWKMFSGEATGDRSAGLSELFGSILMFGKASSQGEVEQQPAESK